MLELRAVVLEGRGDEIAAVAVKLRAVSRYSRSAEFDVDLERVVHLLSDALQLELACAGAAEIGVEWVQFLVSVTRKPRRGPRDPSRQGTGADWER